MRHRRSGRKLGRDASHRKALYANLTSALIEHGRIKTTAAKAKEVKPVAEQMITLGRRGGVHARRQALAYLRSQDVVHKLFSDVGPRFADRQGGYSRIVRIVDCGVAGNAALCGNVTNAAMRLVTVTVTYRPISAAGGSNANTSVIVEWLVAQRL